MDISVGPFGLVAEVVNQGVHVKVSLDFKVIKEEWEILLNAATPEVTLSTGSILGTSASITIGIDNTTGELYSTGEVCVTYPSPEFFDPFNTETACDNYTIRSPVLPAGGLCYLENGLSRDGLSWLFGEHGGPIPSCEDIKIFRSLLNPERSNALTFFTDLARNGGPDFPRACLNVLEGASGNVIADLGNVTSFQWLQILSAVVHDPVVNAYYPGIDNKISFPPGFNSIVSKLPPKESMATEDTNISDRIVQIVTAVATTLGVAIVVVGIIAAIITGIVQLAAMTTALAGAGVIALVILLVLAVVLGVAAVLLGIIITLILLVYLSLQPASRDPLASPRYRLLST